MKLFTKFSIVFLLLIGFGCSEDDHNSSQDFELTVTDADGNIYQSLTIGNQTWLAENLKTTKYNDGTPINLWSFGTDWFSLTSPKAFFQWANTTISGQDLPIDYYGAMYNHYALESGKLAPKGWRIPTEQDFIELELYLSKNGYQNNEAVALKSTAGWLNSSGNGSDAVGFNILPNGYVAFGGTATGSSLIGTYATSNVAKGNLTFSSIRKTISFYDQPTIIYEDNTIGLGFGVRCIKE